MKWTSSEESTNNDHTVSGDTAKRPNQRCQQAHINKGIVECSWSCFRHFNKWKTVSGQWLVWASNTKKRGWRGLDVLRLVLTPWRIEWGQELACVRLEVDWWHAHTMISPPLRSSRETTKTVKWYRHIHQLPNHMGWTFWAAEERSSGVSFTLSDSQQLRLTIRRA